MGDCWRDVPTPNNGSLLPLPGSEGYGVRLICVGYDGQKLTGQKSGSGYTRRKQNTMKVKINGNFPCSQNSNIAFKNFTIHCRKAVMIWYSRRNLILHRLSARRSLCQVGFKRLQSEQVSNSGKNRSKIAGQAATRNSAICSQSILSTVGSGTHSRLQKPITSKICPVFSLMPTPPKKRREIDRMGRLGIEAKKADVVANSYISTACSTIPKSLHGNNLGQIGRVGLEPTT